MTFECKGRFIPEGSTHDDEKYKASVREKYGGDTGAGQLGRWIKEIATGTVVPIEQDWSHVERVYPVLVVYDGRLDRPGHAELFAEEFTKAIEPDSVQPNGSLRKGCFTVAPLAVMPIDVLELLESSVNNFRLTDLLEDYAKARQGGGHLSLYDFLAYTEGRKNTSCRARRLRRAHSACSRRFARKDVSADAVSRRDETVRRIG